jgi:hypothetical protein
MPQPARKTTSASSSVAGDGPQGLSFGTTGEPGKQTRIPPLNLKDTTAKVGAPSPSSSVSATAAPSSSSSVAGSAARQSLFSPQNSKPLVPKPPRPQPQGYPASILTDLSSSSPDRGRSRSTSKDDANSTNGGLSTPDSLSLDGYNNNHTHGQGKGHTAQRSKSSGFWGTQKK